MATPPAAPGPGNGGGNHVGVRLSFIDIFNRLPISPVDDMANRLARHAKLFGQCSQQTFTALSSFIALTDIADLFNRYPGFVMCFAS